MSGLYQRPPFVWRFDIEAARRRLANMTDAERAEAARRYIEARYAPPPLSFADWAEASQLGTRRRWVVS